MFLSGGARQRAVKTVFCFIFNGVKGTRGGEGALDEDRRGNKRKFKKEVTGRTFRIMFSSSSPSPVLESLPSSIRLSKSFLLPGGGGCVLRFWITVRGISRQLYS